MPLHDGLTITAASASGRLPRRWPLFVAPVVGVAFIVGLAVGMVTSHCTHDRFGHMHCHLAWDCPP